MIYGFVDTKKDSTEVRTLYRGKKIAEENLVSMTYSAKLSSILKAGDMIYFSVNYFGSISLLYDFCLKAYQRGATVHFLEQPYLDLGNGKHWKHSIEQDICHRIQTEQEYRNHLFSNMPMSDQCKSFVSQCVSAMNIRMLAKPNFADGILRRGS